MGWVKRLADHVIQDRIGDADLEFAWSDLKTIEPKEQAELLAIYVKEGIKTRNEARGLLGDDPLPGGDALTVDTPQGPLPLAPRLPSPPFRAEWEGEVGRDRTAGILPHAGWNPPLPRYPTSPGRSPRL
jgi:hypothetical protein